MAGVAMGQSEERAGCFGAQPDAWPVATRLNSFRRRREPVAAAIRAVAAVPGLTALDLNYPQHVAPLAPGELGALLAETGLRLTGLNLRFEGERFARGAFTAPDAAVRDEAIAVARAAVDLAREQGARHVVLWLADDGWDVPLQVDHDRLWAWSVDGFRAVAGYANGLRVSVEYKIAEPRRRAVIGSMAEALLAARDVGLPNFGVTLDLCHALMANEAPAAAAAAALRERRLFGVHLNDGYGTADDGLPIGSVRPAQLLELLVALRRGGYDGTIYFDTFPVREDPAAECAANIAALRRFVRLAEQVDDGRLTAAQAEQDALAVRALLTEVGLV